jgi:hypothetical protein
MANTVFDNKVIEAKAKNLLTTAINTRSLMTVDTSLAEDAGMTKTINVYTYTGEAEELGAGEGNSVRGAISFVGTDYKVCFFNQMADRKINFHSTYNYASFHYSSQSLIFFCLSYNAQ